MWMRLERAAVVAALLALTANAAWAKDPPAPSACGNCCKSKKCCKSPQQTNCKDQCGGCCWVKTQSIKNTAPARPIVIFMPCPMNPAAMCPLMPPAAMPMPAPPMPSMAGPPPLMPPHPFVMPTPPGSYCVAQPCPGPKTDSCGETCPMILNVAADICRACSPTPSVPAMCLAALGFLADVCNQRCCTNMAYVAASDLPHPPQNTEVLPPPVPDNTIACQRCVPAPTVVYGDNYCVRVGNASSALIRVSCEKANNRLEWTLADAHMTCKKMTVDMGDSPLTIYTAQGKVRIRSADMKARADCILTDRKDRIILQGDALLHYCKGDQRIHMNGERIELNLRTGAVTIQPTVPLPRLGVVFP